MFVKRVTVNIQRQNVEVLQNINKIRIKRNFREKYNK